MMPVPGVVFEDEGVHNLYPLTLTRPVFGLLCGMYSLEEKLLRGLPAASGTPGLSPAALSGAVPDVRFHMRGYLASDRWQAVESYEEVFGRSETATFINGRLLACEALLCQIDPDWEGKYVAGDTVAVANLTKKRIRELDRSIGSPLDERVFRDLPAKPVDPCMIEYPWDLVALNGKEIAKDFYQSGGGAISSDIPAGVHLVNESDIRISRSVRISPGAVLDASTGPISIEEDVTVMANASLQGPLHVGRGSTIKMGAKIYGETTIGPVCRVGGEVGETIFQGHANKQHDGFVGHSYVGEWVNLGAGTETSDMKNTYSTVKVDVAGKPVDSGHLFVGLFMGDHSKTGIGTTFNTGSCIGACCNIFGAGYPPKNVPSFTWGGSSGFEEYDLDKALETARRAMARRGRSLSEGEEAVLKVVFELTAAGRKKFLAR